MRNNTTKTTNDRKLLIIGSGDLSQAICLALANSNANFQSVTIAGRNIQKARNLAYMANSLAVISNRQPQFNTISINLEEKDTVEYALKQIQPNLTVLCASQYSPKDKIETGSRWSELLTQSPFAVTLPLQTNFAINVADAISRVHPNSLFINGCFPDMVNPILRSFDLPVLCGIGNGSVIRESIKTTPYTPDQKRLKVFAHHVHLRPINNPKNEALAWYDDTKLTNISPLLTNQRAATTRERTLVAGHAAASMLDALIENRTVHTTVPGPHGLPGGYPVRISEGSLDVSLPKQMPLTKAIEWNRRAGILDGADFQEGHILHAASTRRALKRIMPHYSEGYPVEDIDNVKDELLAVRSLMVS